MKRRLKALFKLALIFITIGTIMTLSGLLLGGAGELSKEVSELVHVVRTGVLETVERIPMLESITNINGFTLVVDKDEVSVEVNEEYETISGDYRNMNLATVSGIRNFDISILSGIFTILPSENGFYGIEGKGAEEFQCYVENETLYLSVFPKELGKADQNAEIILYVPVEAELENVLMFFSGDKTEIKTALTGEELRVSSLYGVNAFSDKIDFENVAITVAVGEFRIEHLVAERVDMEVSTGTVAIETMEAGEVSAGVGMGTLKLNGSTLGDMILNCGMGVMEIVLEADQNAYNYDISGSAESVQIGTDTLAGMVMERWIDNGADKQIVLSCSMGSVKIKFQQ